MVPVVFFWLHSLCPAVCAHLPLGAHVLGRAFSDVAIRFLVLGRGSRSLLPEVLIETILLPMPLEWAMLELVLVGLEFIALLGLWLLVSFFSGGVALGLQNETIEIFFLNWGCLGCPVAVFPCVTIQGAAIANFSVGF